MSVLVTGVAGFIGSHVAARLLDEGQEVVGVDNLNSYYSVALKQSRVRRLYGRRGFRFIQEGIENLTLADLGEAPTRIVHLAAQAGVRYSLQNPDAYVTSNLVGFAKVLEVAREAGVQHLVYASSSSVYGANTKVPFSVDHEVNHPISLYAATKRSNELMAQAYSHLFGIPCTGLRFFTVYGPWGRPDMAYFEFARRISIGEPIRLYGEGRLSRDFTFIDDVVEGVVLSLRKPPTPQSVPGEAVNSSVDPHRVFNIGKGHPDLVVDMVDALEDALGKKAIRIHVGRQPGDVDYTWAETEDLRQWCGFLPTTDLRTGVREFASWYLEYRRSTNGGDQP